MFTDRFKVVTFKEDIINWLKNNTHHLKSHWKQQVINRLWNDYGRGRIQCWHINANDKRVQKRSIGQDNMLLILTEKEESILTKEMWDINRDDVIFLYENEREGYVGIFQVVRLVCMRIEQYQPASSVFSLPVPVSIYLTEKGQSERLLSVTEAVNYCLYSAVGNYSGYVTCIMMNPLLLNRQKHNPFGLLRYQLLCLLENYVMNLLDYFDSDEM